MAEHHHHCLGLCCCGLCRNQQRDALLHSANPPGYDRERNFPRNVVPHELFLFRSGVPLAISSKRKGFSIL